MKIIRPLRSSLLHLQTRLFGAASVILLVLVFFQSPLRSISAGSAGLDTMGGALPPPDAIYETNYRSNTIEIFSLAGENLGGFDMPEKPTGLAFDNAGNLFVASDARNNFSIQKIAPDGSESLFANSGLGFPSALAFDRAGNLFVANPSINTIEKFTPDGIGTEFANAADGLNLPVGLAFDTAGNLYVSNGSPGLTSSILKFTPDGVGSVFADSGLQVPF